jgi:Spy/CpxP family protein refolding chaperone
MVFFKKVSSLTTTFIILKIIERNKIMNINIKRAIFAVALTFITGVSVSAQPQNGEDFAKKRTEMMTQKLGLSSEQSAKLLKLNKKYADKMRPMGGKRDGERPSKEDMQKRLKEMKTKMEAYDKDMKEILTEAQYKSYTEMKAQMRGRGFGGGRHGKGNFGKGNHGKKCDKCKDKQGKKCDNCKGCDNCAKADK